MKSFLIALLFAVVMLSATVSATDIEYYGVETRIQKNLTTYNTINLDFNESIKDFELKLEQEIFNLEAEAKYHDVTCTNEYDDKTTINCIMVRTDNENRAKLVLSFITENDITRKGNGYEFGASLPIDYFVQRTFIKVYLPESGALLSDKDESIFPRYGNVISDGKHIIVYWEKENVIRGDDLIYSVEYSIPETEDYYDIAIIVIIAVIIIVSLGIFYMKSIQKPKQTLNVVMPLLKPEEKTIVDILTKNNGEVNQKVLVRETDYSKAKVSRIVTNLNERGIIEVIHMGRTNKIKLLIKK